MTKNYRPAPLADLPANAVISSVETLVHGFRDYERYRCTFTGEEGKPISQTRDLIRGGKVIGVLPLDLKRDEVVLIRQFRLTAHIANGRGDLVEMVAGLVDEGEDPLEAARRECEEEIGLAPEGLIRVLTFLTSPGLADEEMTLYVGSIDASRVPARAGLADEQEDIRPMSVPIDAALAAFSTSAIRNGPLLVALGWLGFNRHRLGDILKAETAGR